MSRCTSTLVSFLLLTYALAASAQTPTIGLYFDENATLTAASFELMAPVEAHVCILQAEMMVAGAAFLLQVPANVMAVGAAYPPGLAIGDIDQGVEVGLTTAVPGFSGVVAIASVQLIVTSGTHADLMVTTHPGYAAPLVSDSLGHLFEAVGTGAVLTQGTPAEPATWSSLKTMFR